MKIHGKKCAGPGEACTCGAQLALDTILWPVSFDGHGFIRDREFGNVAEVRGWGRIQYLDEDDYKKATERQDSIGILIARLLNEAHEKGEF